MFTSTTSKENLKMAEKLTPQALANALAVASRLSPTEMRDLHAMLLKGGEEVVKPKKKKKRIVKKVSKKKKGVRKKKSTPRAQESNFTFQAWPAMTSSSGESSAPVSGRQISNTSQQSQESTDEVSGVSVKMSDLGLRNQGASVAVAESFARDAFGPALDDVEEKNSDESKQEPVPFQQTLREDKKNIPKTKHVKKRRKIKKKKSSASSGTLMKWNPSVAIGK